jgi:hypothetical protein
MTEIVLDTVLVEESNFLWSLKIPLMGLIILSQGSFKEICSKVISRVSFSDDFKAEIMTCLENLMLGVERNMKEKNQAVFSKNFSLLKNLLDTSH